jgi:membrane fusion protein (multidrug efflux system)
MNRLKHCFTTKNIVITHLKTYFVLSSVLLFISCGGNWDEGSWAQAPQLPVIKITKGNYSSERSYPTVLEGIQDIEVRPKIDGYIETIYVDEGQFVKKGQLLFQLETNVISQNTQASNAAIKSAKASVNTAQIEVNRLKPLVEKNIISSIQLQTAEAKLAEAKSLLNQSKSNYQANLANQEYAKITSPVDGYVGKFSFRKGSLVGPATVNSLTTISNTNQTYAYFSVSESEISELTKGLFGKNINEKIKSLPKLKLKLSDGRLYPLQGNIEVSTGKISTKTGAIQLRAIFDNPNGQLLSGNTGVIKIPREYKNDIAIPALSTFNMQGMTMVYTISEGDTLRIRPVKIKGKADRYLIVESGLETGETILAQGLGKVYPNSIVVPYEVPMDSLVNSFQPLFK